MTTAGPQPGQPVVFRNATVLTMDDAHSVLTGTDVLISGERIAALGAGLVMAPATQPWGNRSAIFADPGGNLINVFEEGRLL